MSEPIVQAGLRRMPYRTSLAVVFFSALVAVLCSGSVTVYAPEIWESAANKTALSDEQFRVGMSGAGVGLMLAFVPGLLVDRSTPMLCAFLFSA